MSEYHGSLIITAAISDPVGYRILATYSSTAPAVLGWDINDIAVGQYVAITHSSPLSVIKLWRIHTINSVSTSADLLLEYVDEGTEPDFSTGTAAITTMLDNGMLQPIVWSTLDDPIINYIHEYNYRNITAPASTVTTETSYGQAASTGSSTDYARADHTHGTPSIPTAVQITYDNTTSGMDATNVKTALDEAYAEGGSGGSGGGTAADITFDPTTSDLTATTTQAAIVELSSLVDALQLADTTGALSEDASDALSMLQKIETAIEGALEGKSVSVDGQSYTAQDLNTLYDLRNKYRAEYLRASGTLRTISYADMSDSYST